MLMPSKVKYRKQQRGRMRGKAYRGGTLAFGDMGLQVLEPGWITARQIEAGRIAMTRAVKRGGKIWIRIFPGQAVHEEAGRKRAWARARARPRAGSPWSSPAASSTRWRASTSPRARKRCDLAADKLGLKTRMITRESEMEIR